MKKETILILIFILLLNLFLVSSVAAAKKTIAVTILPQLEMVKAVAGDKVEVVEMIPRGFNPANYSPSPSEMKAFNEASIYFSIGVPADIENILPRAAEMEGLKIVKLFERVENKYEHRYFEEESDPNIKSIKNQLKSQSETDKDHNHSGGRDPHIWLSPARTAYMVEIMRDELIELLPEYKKEFKENTEKYLNKLTAVDQKNKEILAPYQGKEILVYHPSFGYFTEHYGLKMIVIEKEGKDPGPRHLKNVIENAAEKGIKNVFYQAEIDSRKTRSVADSLGGKIIELKPLAKNYIENLRLMAQKLAREFAKRDDY